MSDPRYRRHSRDSTLAKAAVTMCVVTFAHEASVAHFRLASLTNVRREPCRVLQTVATCFVHDQIVPQYTQLITCVHTLKMLGQAGCSAGRVDSLRMFVQLVIPRTLSRSLGLTTQHLEPQKAPMPSRSPSIQISAKTPKHLP